jgi:hypothetical protein
MLDLLKNIYIPKPTLGLVVACFLIQEEEAKVAPTPTTVPVC